MNPNGIMRSFVIARIDDLLILCYKGALYLSRNANKTKEFLMKQYFFESRDYPLHNIDGALEAGDQPDTGLLHDRPQLRYSTTVRLLGLLEDATPADLYEIVTDLDKRLGFCRLLTANEIFPLLDQNRELSKGRDFFVVGSVVRITDNNERIEPSWLRVDPHREDLGYKTLRVFQYPLAIHPASRAWKEELYFKGKCSQEAECGEKSRCNQRIPIIVTKPSHLIGTDLGTYTL